jgi:hypothetical protein
MLFKIILKLFPTSSSMSVAKWIRYHRRGDAGILRLFTNVHSLKCGGLFT